LHNFGIKYQVKEVLRLASAPSVITNQRLKRVVRFLLGHGHVTIVYDWQPLQKVLKVKVDANHAGCSRTGKSTTCCILMHGSHFLMGSSNTQPIVTLSSGESELHAQVRGFVDGIYAKNLLKFYDHSVKIIMENDSSASRGALSRSGCGKKMRHVHTKLFWVQGLVRDRIVELKTILGLENEADVGTKHLTEERLLKLLAKCGIYLRPVAESLLTA